MPHVNIVMATRNGARFLGEQLDSFAGQTHPDWSLLVSDDGSSDATREIVARFAAAHPDRDIRVVDGPARGNAGANFLHALSLTATAPGDVLALSDQDDIWFPQRLERALELIGPAASPAGPGTVYAARTMHCDIAGRPQQMSRRHPRGPSFGNALVQNILAGNTIALDAAAAALVCDTAAQVLSVRTGQGVAHHDWWIYALSTGAGLRIVIDDRPVLYYRQHPDNLMGAHRGLLRHASRLSMIRDGRFAGWIRANVEALDLLDPRLTPEARVLRALFADWLDGAPVPVSELRRAGLSRQTPAGNLLLTGLMRRGLLRQGTRGRLSAV